MKRKHENIWRRGAREDTGFRLERTFVSVLIIYESGVFWGNFWSLFIELASGTTSYFRPFGYGVPGKM